MEEFFKSIERQAFRMAQFACHNRDDALDLVQDSMCRFVDKYSRKPEGEWKALFYKILQNRIRDHYRRESVRTRWRIWLKRDTDNVTEDPLEQFSRPDENNPEQLTGQEQTFHKLRKELEKLSLKQQQVFLMRAWEGLTVKETARAMNCSEGTVKTHYFRATEQLKKTLGDDWR